MVKHHRANGLDDVPFVVEMKLENGGYRTWKKQVEKEIGVIPVDSRFFARHALKRTSRKRASARNNYDQIDYGDLDERHGYAANGLVEVRPRSCASTFVHPVRQPGRNSPSTTACRIAENSTAKHEW